MSEEKVFIGNGKEKVFDEGGSILKYSLSKEDVQKIVQISNDTEEGWVNIDIKRRRAVSDKGVTHYGQWNTWKPKNQQEKIPF